uniref:DC1 domain-containing protein n=1 Tax=Leersia perrieri TaxID=77586 RepID=A0A0D9X7P6_9ORYZ
MKGSNVMPATATAIWSHPFHREHDLTLVASAAGGKAEWYRCDGCKERGSTTSERYTCETCDFDLHIACALAQDVMPDHQLFNGRSFHLLHELPPPERGFRRVCDACGDEVRGFVYHCFDGDLDIHPCCAQLPDHVALHGIKFQLCGGDSGNVPSGCAFCTGKEPYSWVRSTAWTYRACYDGEDMFLHVACVKEMAPAQPPATINHPFHEFHPKHDLTLVASAAGGKAEWYRCDGCKERGSTTSERYTCETCDFDLHIACALAQDVMPDHQLFNGRSFHLLHELPPPERGFRRVCDACGDEVRGFVYHCFDGDLDIHPCCAQLPDHVALHGIDFRLCGGDGRNVPRRCAFCTGNEPYSCVRRKVWTYRACYDGEDMFLHVACVKEMVQEILAGHHGGSSSGGGKIVVRESVLMGVMQKRSKSSKAVKCFLKFVLSVVVSVLFGDPTGLAVALVGAVFSNV